MTSKLPALRGPLTRKQILKKMAGGHAVFSPSGAEMTTTCAESIVINALADDEPSIDSATGTVAHWLAEKWLKTGKRPDRFIGTTRVESGFEVDIDEEMMEFVGDFVRHCQALAKIAEESFTERRVDISDLTPIPDQGGTLDFGAMGAGWLKIVDLKYGKEQVQAFNDESGMINKQLGIYAWGIFLEFDWLYNFQKITVAIVQPRLHGGYSEYTITREELKAFARKIRAAWAYNWANPTTRQASVKGCRWCAGRASCGALYLLAVKATSDVGRNHDEIEDGEFEEVVTSKELVAAESRILDEFEPSPFPKLPDPTKLSTAAMEKLLTYRKLMDTFFHAIEQELLSRAISDEEDLRRWKVVMSRSRRAFVDDWDQVVELAESKGLDRSHLFKTTKVSPAELERIFHTKLKMKLADAKRLLASSGLVVQPPGNKTLAPKSDNRKALPKETDVFRNWDTEEENGE